MLNGARRANLISLARWRLRSATVFPGCLLIRKHFLHSGNTYHHIFFAEVNNLLSYFSKKTYSSRFLLPFILSAFNNKKKNYDSRQTIWTETDNKKLGYDSELFITTFRSLCTTCKFFKPGYKLKWENPHSRSNSARNHCLLNRTSNFFSGIIYFQLAAKIKTLQCAMQDF